MIETLRPNILPDNRKVLYYILASGLSISAIGAAVKNPIMFVLPLMILAVLPGLPILFHLFWHLLVRIEIYPEKIAVIDYTGDSLIRAHSHQEMHFNDICYIYYACKEVDLLVNLRNKLKKFKIPAKETNYTRQNLTAKYGVPDDVIRKFEEDSHKTLNDYTATAVLMKLEEIYDKHNVSKKIRKAIKKGLAIDENFNLEYVQDALTSYPITKQEIEELSDQFTEINVDILTPFLQTKADIVKYIKLQGTRSDFSVKMNCTLVISNADGTQKLYLMHFFAMSIKDWRRLINEINIRKPGIKYLMTKTDLAHLLGK